MSRGRVILWARARLSESAAAQCPEHPLSLPAPAPRKMIPSSSSYWWNEEQSQFWLKYFVTNKEKMRDKLIWVIQTSELQQSCSEQSAYHVRSLEWANQRPGWGEADQWEASIGDAGQGPLEPIIPAYFSISVIAGIYWASPQSVQRHEARKQENIFLGRLITGVSQDENKPINMKTGGIFVLSCTFMRLQFAVAGVQQTVTKSWGDFQI